MSNGMPIPPGAKPAVQEELLDVANEAPVSAPVPPTPIAPKVASQKRIKVVAIRPGFIFQERKAPGDKFEVTENQLGSWMKCEDSVEQRKHEQRMLARNRAINAAAMREDEREKHLADE
jgi:hypothetical protein